MLQNFDGMIKNEIFTKYARNIQLCTLYDNLQGQSGSLPKTKYFKTEIPTMSVRNVQQSMHAYVLYNFS